MSVAADVLTSPLELVLGDAWAAVVRPAPRRTGVAGVAGAVRQAHEVLDGVAEAPVWSLTGSQTGELIVALEQLTAKAAALQARVLAHAARDAGTWHTGSATSGRSGGAHDDRSGWVSQGDLVGWLAESLPVTRAEAGRRVRAARDLDTGDHAPVAAAMAAGRVSAAQAAVIIEAVDRVPAGAVVGAVVGADDGGEATETPARDLARTHLIEAARTWHVPALRKLGRRIHEVIDPEGAETREAARLAAQEGAAHARWSLSMAQDAQGCWVGRFVLPELTGSMLHKALTAIANPARTTDPGASAGREEPAGTTLRRSPRLKLGEAFCEYVERFPAAALPAAAGGAATVVVTTSLEDLRTDLGEEVAGAATLDTGGRLSAGEARRLACTAGVVPVVLGGASQPLDLGRERRLHSRAQRLAMSVRDGGCRAHGCDWPPGMCHAHHLRPWSQGGHTTVDDGVLLCPRHHRLAHRPGTVLVLDEDRRAQFARAP
ncbi:HNH endonuclease [Nocardioidaceae bacterium]|nr:HNH endonuclease [Nocardioidaceae bacterium]